MLEKLKKEVLEANLLLPKNGLVLFTWGNVSAIDKERKYVVIKPSGVEYATMTVDDMVVTDLEGNVVEGKLNPSSDLHTHLELYCQFSCINSVVHTHATEATSWAQALCDIPALGTTHADYFNGPIPCTRLLTAEEIRKDYELNTGKVIIETFRKRHINPEEMPAVLVASHGPFTWGKDANEAVFNSVVLEELAKMAYRSMTIKADTKPMQNELMAKHFYRKHGPNAYYGQKK